MPKNSKEDKNNLHLGHRQRMRERCKNFGTASLANHELIEMLLYYCIPMKDTNAIAHKILNDFGSIPMILEADSHDIERRCGLSENSALFFGLVAELIKRNNSEKWLPRTVINSSSLAGEFAVSLLSYERNECFYVICLDSQNRLISSVLLSEGTVSEAYIYPRNVVEAALRYKARSIILTHNHPGGDKKPSMEDIMFTKKIVSVMNSINIYVFDHIIVADNDYISLADKGLLINRIDE